MSQEMKPDLIPGGTPHMPVPPDPVATISLATIESILGPEESLEEPVKNLDKQLRELSNKENNDEHNSGNHS
jgi:hypothetical protein